MASTRFAQARGVQVAWQREGDGRTLVWGHGLTSSRASEDAFRSIDHGTLANHFDLIRYDARGHGETTVTFEPADYSWDNMARDQLALTDSLGVSSYIAAGASLGTATAVHAAVIAPERIDGLVLVVPPTAWETRGAQTDRYELMAQIVEAKGTGPLIRGLDAVPVPDPFIGNEHRRAHQQESLRSADPVRLAAVYRGATTANLPPRDVVATIDVPTLILAWSGDPAHPESTAVELQELIVGSELEVAHTAAEMATWADRVVEFSTQLDG